MKQRMWALAKLLFEQTRTFGTETTGRATFPTSSSRHMQSLSFTARPPPQGPVDHFKRLLRPTAFCIAASGTYFYVAARSESHRRKEQDRPFWSRQRQRQPSVPDWLYRLPEGLRDFVLEARESWRRLPGEQRTVYGLVAANVMVHLMWRTPSLAPFMLRHFTQALPPHRSALHTMVTSTFSHVSTVHLLCNMLALSSFGTTCAQVLGKEQFLAFYLSAGMASSLASIAGRVASTTGGISIGASGAVYACFALTSVLYPDNTAVLIFLPMVPIAMGTLLKITMGLDVVGILAGWKALDHWGHLGGASFGVWYTLQGHRLWQQRHKLLGDGQRQSR